MNESQQREIRSELRTLPIFTLPISLCLFLRLRKNHLIKVGNFQIVFQTRNQFQILPNSKSNRCKMEYIGETGRQLKIRMKEHETDSKIDFRRRKKINQIGVQQRFWQTKITIGNADLRRRILLLNTRIKHHF